MPTIHINGQDEAENRSRAADSSWYYLKSGGSKHASSRVFSVISIVGESMLLETMGGEVVSLESHSGESRELSWYEILVAGQATSFRFLDDEPDLYTDEDGEPV